MYHIWNAFCLRFLKTRNNALKVFTHLHHMFFTFFFFLIIGDVFGYRAYDHDTKPHLPVWRHITPGSPDLKKNLKLEAELNETANNFLHIQVKKIVLDLPKSFRASEETISAPEYQIGLSVDKLVDNNPDMHDDALNFCLRSFVGNSRAYWSESKDLRTESDETGYFWDGFPSEFPSSSDVLEAPLTFEGKELDELNEFAIQFNLEDHLDRKYNPETSIFLHIKVEDILYDDWVLENQPITDDIVEKLFLPVYEEIAGRTADRPYLERINDLKQALYNGSFNMIPRTETDFDVPFKVAHLSDERDRQGFKKEMIDNPDAGKLTFSVTYSWKTSSRLKPVSET